MAKSAEAFRTISEVSEILDVPAHVLRFWESRFSQIKPLKRAGGRRYYRPNDIALIGGIRQLLHEDGLTIRGVQKILREQGVRFVAGLCTLTLSDEAEPAASPTEDAHWPDSPSPETAATNDDLLPDPDDMPAEPHSGLMPRVIETMRTDTARRSPPAAPEAPMDVDVPTLPDEPVEASVHAFSSPQTNSPDATGSVEELAPVSPDGIPAAAMLRAMDAARANDKKAELLAVYLRLTRLRDRVAQGAGAPRP